MNNQTPVFPIPYFLYPYKISLNAGINEIINKNDHKSKYSPHQGSKECARRMKRKTQ